MILIGAAVLFFAASFWVSSGVVAKMLRVSAFVELVCGYFTSVFIRVHDSYKLWPGATSSPDPSRPRATWRGRVAAYTFCFGLGILSIALLCWIVAL